MADDQSSDRRSLAIEMGFVMPAVRILDNVQLDANSYVIKIKEVEAGTGKVWHGQYMVMDPAGNQVTLPGVHTTEPTFGLPATWIDAALKEEASVKGYTVVDAATVLATHLTELIKANMSELLSYGEVQKLTKELPKEQSELIKDIVPSLITISGIQRVLQILLAERVSIRDLATILEGIADGLAATRNPASWPSMCARACRASFAPSIRVRPAICRSSRSRPDGSRFLPNPSSVRATTATSPCNPPSSPNSSIWCARNSSRRRARAKRRCW